MIHAIRMGRARLPASTTQRKVEIMELTIFAHAKDTSELNKDNAKVVFETTHHKTFKVVKLNGTDQYGQPIKVKVFMDPKQPVKKVVNYSSDHPKYK